MKKAIFKGYQYERGSNRRFSVYEYRGYTYTVNPYLYTSSGDQHRSEQINIDYTIEKKEACEKRDREMEEKGIHKETAHEALKGFFDLFDGK